MRKKQTQSTASQVEEVKVEEVKVVSIHSEAEAAR